ncbi:MAG: transglycosylase SLT domain-containing protein [Methylomonas sp.]
MNRQTTATKPLPRPSKRPASPTGTPTIKSKPKPKSKPKATRKKKPNKRGQFRHKLPFLALECVGLVSSAVMLTMPALGYSANLFSGSGLFSSLLPFAIGVVSLILLAALLLIGWSKVRTWLLAKAEAAPAMLSGMLALGCLWFVFHDGYTPAFTHFRTLVGGKQQAARTTLAHQVFAAYRRYDESQLQKMIDRAAVFNADIQDAAESFDLDPNILLGVAATESSFMPRDSHDGGHGLFQITAVPKFVMEEARRELSVDELSLADSRHNAFIAAATLKHYLEDMHNDLFLGLLAYNIGPRNGGLRFIMQQYGATDFISMQPYIQQLPRDYPIRVLSYALAFRLWQHDGKLLAYQEGDNAIHIQRLGIPGMETNF